MRLRWGTASSAGLLLVGRVDVLVIGLTSPALGGRAEAHDEQQLATDDCAESEPREGELDGGEAAEADVRSRNPLPQIPARAAPGPTR